MKMQKINIVIFIIFIIITNFICAQKYNNGKYLHSGDANIYYEIHGKGEPIVLLHGGYAYIDQFDGFIKVLEKEYKVIAVAQRGYGRSSIGSKPYSHARCAEDVHAIIEKECDGKAMIIGFSSGSNIGYLVAQNHPESVKKLIVMGGALNTQGIIYDPEDISRILGIYHPDFKDIMPEPDRWDEIMEKMATMWNEPQLLAFNDLSKITSPVLMIYGDRDAYCPLETITRIYRHLPNASLAIIPNAKHLDVSFWNIMLLDRYILEFLRDQ